MTQTSIQTPTTSAKKRKNWEETSRLREIFLKDVQLNKQLLFGPFSPTVTDKKKMEKWEEIRNKMVIEGEKLLESKDAKYVKSTYWQNIRTSSLSKYDNCKATGSEPKEALSKVCVCYSYNPCSKRGYFFNLVR